MYPRPSQNFNLIAYYMRALLQRSRQRLPLFFRRRSYMILQLDKNVIFPNCPGNETGLHRDNMIQILTLHLTYCCAEVLLYIPSHIMCIVYLHGDIIRVAKRCFVRRSCAFLRSLSFIQKERMDKRRILCCSVRRL